MLEIYSSTSFAMEIKSISIRPQVGQEINVAALEASRMILIIHVQL